MAEIFCENTFCIYWEGDKCILLDVRLDESGVCTDCIQMEIEQQISKATRQALLEK